MLGIMAPVLEEDRKVFGNRCGHVPDAPCYFIPSKEHKLRPSVIQFAMNNLEHYYLKPSYWLESLKRTRLSKKKQRSEARERDAAVLGVLLHYTELASLRVGFYDSVGSFVSLDMRFIARQLGWRTLEDDKKDSKRLEQGLKPKAKGIKRVWRSINNLKRAGYLTVHQQFKLEKKGDNEHEAVYKGFAAIRAINAKLFTELGIKLTELDRKRKEASKRLKRKWREAVQQVEFTLSNIRKGIPTAINDIIKKVDVPSVSLQKKQAQLVREKERQQKCFELKILPENKDLSSEEFYIKYPHLRKRE